MVFHPAYFGPIIQYVAIVKSGKVVFELCDNYQKQTYRNRCYISGPNGKQLLTVPVIHLKSKDKKLTKDIRIDNGYHWQRIHGKALYTAYRSSPFFEFYIEDFDRIFNKRFDYLIDLNLAVNDVLFNILELRAKIEKTSHYEIKYSTDEEGRYFINAKDKRHYNLTTYDQVFDQKQAFIPNLSILDLLFNEGPNTLEYLENHQHLIE